MRHAYLIAYIFASMTVSGCANAPSPQSILPNIPASFQSVAALPTSTTTLDVPTLQQSGWIEVLEDEALVALIKEALAHNHDLGAAAARLEVARQGAYGTRANLLPNFSVRLTPTRQASPSSLADTGSSDRLYTTNYLAAGQLDWEIDLWGRLRNTTRASMMDAEAMQADLAAATLSITGAVVSAYYALLESHLQVELAQNDVATGEANLHITERRYQRGLSSGLDVRLARASLQSSKAGLITRQQNYKIQTRSLETLLGRYPKADLITQTELPAMDKLDLAQVVLFTGEGPRTLATHRPDILAAERRLEAAGLRVQAARKALVPALRLSGTLTNTSDDFDDMFTTDALAGVLSASLIQPLFQGGRLRANLAGQQANQQNTLHQYAQTVLRAYEEIENTLDAEFFLEQREQALRLAFKEAMASERLAERQFTNGTTNIFNLISAQQRRIATQSQFIASTRARLVNRIAIYIALGAAPLPMTDDQELVALFTKRTKL